MAHVRILETPSAAIRVLFCVDAPVGRGSPNRRDDVLLVQFLLAAMWNKTIDGAAFGTGAAPRVDGVCGPKTIDAIRAFQLWYWPKGGERHLDGRVDVLPPNSVRGPRHEHIYIIIGLNVNFGLLYGIERHFALSKEPGFPPLLRPVLFVAN